MNALRSQLAIAAARVAEDLEAAGQVVADVPTLDLAERLIAELDDARVQVSEARVRAVLRAEGIAAAPAARGRPASPRPRRPARGVLLAVLTEIATRAGVTPEAALTYLAAQLADPGVTAAIRRTT